MDSVAHVQVIPKLSGAQIFSLNILKEVECKNKYLICSSSEPVTDMQKKEFIEAFKSAGVKIIWLDNLRRNIGLHDFYVLFDYWRLFRKYKFQILHTNSTKPGVSARVMARLSGIKKVIHTVHGIAFHKNESFLKRVFYYFLEIIALQFGHVNVSVNDFYLKYYKPFFWKRSLRIYNGLDFEKLSRDFENQLHEIPDSKNTHSSKKKVLFVGRLDNQKNPLSAIKAFHLLSQVNPLVLFDIVGDGELREECESLVEKLKLDDRVTFHGWVHNPHQFYIQSDVFFCPSSYEAFGFTFTEAAFFAKPIVASDVEGIPEVVIHGEMGFLCDPFDCIAQADYLNMLLQDEALSSKFGQYGHVHVQSMFPLQKCYEGYQQLYLQ